MYVYQAHVNAMNDKISTKNPYASSSFPTSSPPSSWSWLPSPVVPPHYGDLLESRMDSIHPDIPSVVDLDGPF